MTTLSLLALAAVLAVVDPKRYCLGFGTVAGFVLAVGLLWAEAGRLAPDML